MQGRIRNTALIVGAVALALRLARLYEAPGADPFYEVYLLDSSYYDELARRLLGQGEPVTGPYLMAPLYAYFLAFIYAIRDGLGMADTPGLVYGVQVVLGAATASMAALLGGRLGGRAGAWTAGLLVALYPVGILYDVKLLSVTLATALATLGALLTLSLWDRLERGEAVFGLALGAGLALGLATTARGNLIFSLPFLLALLGWRAIRDRGGRLALVGLALGLALPLGATYAHNRAAGSPALVSVNGGVNLYRGNNPYVVDEAVEPFRLPAERDALANRSRLIASVESDRWLTPSESDQYWSRRAMAHWREDPVRYVGLTLRKAWQVLDWEEVQDNVDHNFLIGRSAFLRYLPPLYGLMVALGLGGLLVTIRRRELAQLAVLVVTGVGGIALFFVVARYRVPLVPLWAAYSAAFVGWVVQGWREGARGQVGRAVVGVAVLCGALTLSPTSAALPWNWLVVDRPPPECLLNPHILRDPAIEAEYGVAFRKMLDGDVAAGEAGMAEVWRKDPGHLAAGVNLSYLLVQRGDYARAESVSSEVLRRDPCEEKAWLNLGNALLKQGKVPAGLGALHRAVEVDPYDPDKHAALGNAWLLAGRKAEARKELEFAVRWDPQSWKARGLLARLALQDKDMDEAQQLLEEALKAAPQQVDLYGLLGLATLGKGDLEGAQRALEGGEAAMKARGGPPDPVLTALRKALDQPFVLPDKDKIHLSVKPGVGP